MKRMNGFFRVLTAVFFLLFFVPSVFGATVDVMIVYDSTAKAWVDSNGGMNTFAADAVARMNQASASSNLDLTFRLAHAAEVSYTYSGSLGTDLTNIRAGTGNLSVVHEWRDTYGADLVALLVDTGSAYGVVGVGYTLSTYSGDPAYAYTCNAIQSVDISHTLTHEVGHNLGAHHSKFQTPSPGPNSALNSYSAGWYFTGTNATQYHTIMAYNADGYGNFYVEAPLFSTPLLSYEGTVAGDAEDGDNARTIRQTMNVVAAYRSAGGATVTLNPTADALLATEMPDTNFGTFGTFSVGKRVGYDDYYGALLQFNISSIPSNATIESASLRISSDIPGTGSMFQVEAYALIDAWTETGVTANNAPSIELPPSPRAWVNLSHPSTLQIDVTAIVKKWHSAELVNHGIGLTTFHISDNPEGSKSFQSRENTTKPRLTINYSVPTVLLTVASSNPTSGVSMTVSPNDNSGLGSGSTQFTRTYNSGTSVTVTAPSTTGGNDFSSWSGCTSTSGRICYVTMSAAKTVTAAYSTPTPTYQLTVASSNPTSGVSMTVSPNDNSGLGSGSTQFTRTYNSGTSVTVTAPSTTGGNDFSSWSGCTSTSGRICYVTMSAAKTVTAEFTPQTSCTYSISPTSIRVNGESGSGTVSVTASGSTCPWTAASFAEWITIKSGSNGIGNGTVNYSYTALPSGTSARFSSMIIAGHAFSFAQQSSITFDGRQWSVSNASVIVLNDEFLVIVSDGGYDDWAETILSLPLSSQKPLVMEQRIKLRSGGSNYLLPGQTIYFENSTDVTALTISALPGQSYGWNFGGWTQIGDHMPPNEDYWAVTRIVITPTGGKLFVKPDDAARGWFSDTFYHIASKQWSHSRIEKVRFSQPWDSVNYIDYFKVYNKSTSLPWLLLLLGS